MKDIIEKAENYKYNSLGYVDEEDIVQASVYMNCDEAIFLYQKSEHKKELYWDANSNGNIQVFWAANSKEEFIGGFKQMIQHIKNNEPDAEMMYTEFVPEEFLEDMAGVGFKIASEWVDFWNNELCACTTGLPEKCAIRSLKKDEITDASALTKSCVGYSRGFAGQSDELIKEWMEKENSHMFAAEVDGKLAGIGFFILYGFDSDKGTILWVRELAVSPEYQSKGIGRALLNHGIKWGIGMGAKRSFLACDAENHNAIKLYESMNYKRKDERGQINIELKLK